MFCSLENLNIHVQTTRTFDRFTLKSFTSLFFIFSYHKLDNGDSVCQVSCHVRGGREGDYLCWCINISSVHLGQIVRNNW